jgi:hypothetical protein
MRDDTKNVIVDLTFKAGETEHWLRLCKSSKSYPKPAEPLACLQVIQRITSKIISWSKNNSRMQITIIKFSSSQFFKFCIC